MDEKEILVKLIKCDIAVIGAGAGGLSVAAAASQLGAKVVLIENHKMGGDCLNYGCIPSKSLLAASKIANSYRYGATMGIAMHKPTIDFAGVMNYVARVIESIAPNDSVERFTSLGVDVIQAPAQFQDQRTLLAGEAQIKARRIVIATGSSPAIPFIPGLESVHYYTNETIFELREKPNHLIIIGGGPIGCELAQAFHALQVNVTVLEAFTILPKDEPDLVNIVREYLIAQNINLHEDTKINRVDSKNNEIRIEIEKNGNKKTIIGSHLLIAAGRRANVQDIALEKAGIEYSAKGIKTDSYLRTSNRHVYAIGDVTGGYQFTHMANYHAGIVIKNILFRLPAKVDYNAVPWVTYIHPELSHVGLSSADALKKHQDAKIICMDLAEIDRPHTDNETIGKIKITATKKGKVLGVSILSPHAGELILPWIMMIREGKSLRSLTDAIVPYPTYGEISKRVAGEFYKPLLFSSKTKMLVKFLSIFG